MLVRVPFEVESDPEAGTGWIARLSLAGVDIETLQAPPVGSRVVQSAAKSCPPALLRPASNPQSMRANVEQGGES
jgi:hypothetical protein